MAAFVCLVPVEHQSGSSVLRRPPLSKNGDAKTRAMLYKAAIVATRHNPDMRAQYERLCATGRAKMAHHRHGIFRYHGLPDIPGQAGLHDPKPRTSVRGFFTTTSKHHSLADSYCLTSIMRIIIISYII